MKNSYRLLISWVLRGEERAFRYSVQVWVQVEFPFFNQVAENSWGSLLTSAANLVHIVIFIYNVIYKYIYNIYKVYIFQFWSLIHKSYNYDQKLLINSCLKMDSCRGNLQMACTDWMDDVGGNPESWEIPWPCIKMRRPLRDETSPPGSPCPRASEEPQTSQQRHVLQTQ